MYCVLVCLCGDVESNPGPTVCKSCPHGGAIASVMDILFILPEMLIIMYMVEILLAQHMSKVGVY